MSVSCDCKAAPRVYDYGNSEVDYDVDARTKIRAQEYLNDNTIDYFDLPYCQSIGEEAFKNSSLEEISAPECKEIGGSAFYGCENLANVYLPNVSVVPTSAFYAAKVPEGNNYWDFSSVEKIQANAFRNLEVGSTANLSIEFSSVREIGSSAFAMTNRWPRNGQSTELILPNCTKIEAEAFKGSWDIHGEWQKQFSLISLPRIETIGNGAFSVLGEVNNNIEIHFGPYCTTIGEMIFDDWGCEHAKLYVHAINPPTLQGYLVSIFDYDVPSQLRPPRIYVPAQSVNAYKTANKWSAYASRIEAMPEGTVIPT